ncbi:hypothetical protein [Paenibacillus donghaensis]|uniref:Uncharacterized protein n=1 Tax=Paenibacillus donghaensis TaxID=414771 RepID=A0A2Z2KDZ6_9BACL|nr:hypothetical protein [Paenibacillus donghaensis]ASA22075.1 hypothetical protein B9T62_15605 [Paenibacillus donghaensis]
MKISIPKESKGLAVGEVCLDIERDKVYIGTAEGPKEINPNTLSADVVVEIEALKNSRGGMNDADY